MPSRGGWGQIAGLGIILAYSAATWAFDSEGDRDVDLIDYGAFHACLTGPDVAELAAECLFADGDGNGVVDLHDFGLFQLCFSGSDVGADGQCQPLGVQIGAPDNLLIGFPTPIGAALANLKGDATFQWEIVEGPGVLENATSQTPSITALSTDPIIVRVTVSDSGSSWASRDSVNMGVVTEPMAPEVTIVAFPDTTVDEDTVLLLKAFSSDPLGLRIVEVVWTQFAGPLLNDPFSNPTSAATNFNTCCPGVYEVAAVARNELGMLGKATETVTIVDVGPSDLVVNAGVDRAFAAGEQGPGTVPLTDFPGAYPGFGELLRAEFGLGPIIPPPGVDHPVGRIYRDLSATASDSSFDNDQLTFAWACQSAPAPASCANVTLLDSSSASTGFLLLPVATEPLTGLTNSGMTTDLFNLVVPGGYTFGVMATNPNGDTVSDEVTWTITPRFAIPAASGGSLEGMALQTGQVTNRVKGANSFNAPFTVLARTAGTLRFLLSDTSVAADAQLPMPLNDAALSPSDPVTTASAEAIVAATTRGTYTLNGQFESDQASVPSTPTDVMVHVQNVLSGAIDTNASFPGSGNTHFGRVNSTNLSTQAINVFHGARATDGGNDFWDGEVVISCDMNDDGFPETITADGNVLSIMTGLTADPTVNSSSPFANALNNDGVLTENAAGGAGTIDSFALTDSNMTGTVPNVTQVTSMCCGDFDGDGNTDLAVGEGGFDAGADAGSEGRVLVFYGQGNIAFVGQNGWTTNGNTVASGALLAQPKVITRPDGTINGIIDRDDHFGHAMVCCDVNGDGLDDIIVGAPGGGQAITVAGSGVLVNGAGQFGTTLSTDTVDATTVFEPGDLCVVDVNNTAFSYVRRVTAVTPTQLTFDLAIGNAAADNETVDEIVGATGAVFGILGNSIRLPNSTTIGDTGSGTDFRIIPNVSISGDLLGASLCCGDFNGDLIDDIMFGAPGRKDSATATRVAAGTVFVTFGRTTGLSGNLNTIDRIYQGNVAGLGFGRALGCCDWNGAGGTDLVVSAGVGPTLGAVGTGRLYLIDSTTNNIFSSANGNSDLTSVPQISGGQTDSNLGARIGCWEFTGDNFWDILVTAPSATAAHQQVIVINGNDSFSTFVSASTTFTDSDTTHTLLTAVTGIRLWGDADSPFDVDAALFFTDGVGFVDTNGDKVMDLFFQGDTVDAQNVSNAYTVMGAE